MQRDPHLHVTRDVDELVIQSSLYSPPLDSVAAVSQQASLVHSVA